MGSPSAKLGLTIAAGADTFSTAVYDANLQIVDNYPGFFVCTSTTRPGMGGGPAAWGVAQTGMRISETDSGLTWGWNGTAFVRSAGIGMLGRVTSTSNLGTTSTWQPPGTGTLTTLLSQVVHPPVGNRSLMIVAEVPEVTNPSGLSYLAILRGSTILTAWPVWTAQEEGTGNAGLPGSKGEFITFDSPNSTSVTYTLSFAASVTLGGTSTILGSAGRPAALTVVEF